jgi:transcriptional regulator with XRE-family HTH domain
MAELTMHQADLARAAGVSDPTVRDLMRGLPGDRRKQTLWKVSLALGWNRHEIERIRDATEQPPVSSETAELRRLVETIQRTVEVERAEAHRHGLAIERLADGLQQLLDAMPQQDGATQPPSNAAH